jgi:signal transduction histidine kinase
MFPFQYRRVSAEFINALSTKVARGESVILLGPRFIGKRHVINRLRAAAQRDGLAPLLEVRFFTGKPVNTSDAAAKLIRQAVEQTGLVTPLRGRPNDDSDASPLGWPSFKAPPGPGSDFLSLGTSNDDLLRPVTELAAAIGKPITLFATNVDTMAHHLARRFLRSAQAHVNERRLVIVMSVEEDFHDLVHGDNSEFRCANQYFLQGYEEDAFDEFITQYTNHMRFEFASPPEARHLIWEQTGGNLYTLRMLLWSIIQMRVRKDIPPEQPVELDDIPGTLRLDAIPGVYGAQVFRHATELIDQEPKCWGDLADLIQDKSVRPPDGTVPSRLELAGIAVREQPPGKPERLKLASPIIKALVSQYYDARRFGDLYARAGLWSKAIKKYGPPGDEAMVRPSGVNDRSGVEATVNAIGESFYSETAQALQSSHIPQVSEKLKALFANGCRYVLGFREVTFWQRGPSSGSQDSWQIQPLADHKVTPAVASKIAGHLVSYAKVEPGKPLSLSQEAERCAVAFGLPSLQSGMGAAVVVSDFERGSVISRERERLVKNLLTHFIKALGHAVGFEKVLMRNRIRARYIDIMNDIFSSLGSRELSVSSVIDKAARGLEQLDYARVVFYLVNPVAQTIEGVYDSCKDARNNLASGFVQELRDKTAGLPVFLIGSKRPITIANTSVEPLAVRIRQAGIKTVAAVPILSPDGRAIGAILVERAKSVIPSKEEVGDLEAFGRQLAIAIEQCERVNLLESCLNKIPEPLLIADRTESRRYQNKAAAALLGGDTGWLEPDRAGRLTEKEAGVIVKLIADTLTTGQRRLKEVTGVGRDPEYRGEAITDTLQDWRNNIVGSLLRLQDRTYLHKYEEAFRLVALASDTDGALENMLKATRMLGHEWGRLYRVREEAGGDGPVFVSELSYGHPDEQYEKEFNDHQVRLQAANTGSRDWLCIRNREPVIFCWNNDIDDGAEYVTPHALKAINWRNPPHPPHAQKHLGDFWMDFPLIKDGNILGKICLQCDENLRPENFELLKALSVNFADLLDAFLSRARDVSAKQDLIKVAAAQKIMATMAHNIGTRLGSLPIINSRYRQLEKQFGDLAPLNLEFAHVIEHIMVTVKRAHELLSPVSVERVPTDLEQLIRRTLQSALPAGAWGFECKRCPLQVDVDVHLMETALLEMIQNSRDAAPAEDKLRVWVEADLLEVDLLHGGVDCVKLVYKDNGPGVPKEFRNRIFEDFFSRRPRRKRTGTGLGLGFIRRVIEAHDGTIHYEERGWKGARFVITFPVHAPPADEERH